MRGRYSLSFRKLTVFHTLDIRRPVVPISGKGQSYSIEAYDEEEFYEAEGWGYASWWQCCPLLIFFYDHFIYVVIVASGYFCKIVMYFEIDGWL